jgi:hypothetical protein
VSEVFLSYAGPDRAIATQLASDLSDKGVTVWSDLDLHLGDNWQNQIATHLESATAVIVLVSRSSLDSKWITQEWSAALARSSRVIPALAGGASFGDLPKPLSSRVGVDLNEDYEQAVHLLVSAIEGLQVSEEPAASEVVDLEKLVEDITSKVIKRIGVRAERVQMPPETVDDKLVFVVCSFDAAMEPVFEAISVAAESVGLRAERVKDVKGDYRITEKILSMLRAARLVVVDLSRERPNVYFELGYARGLNKTVITIVRAETRVHFDVQDWTYLEYYDSRPLERQLRERFLYELGGMTR